MVTIGLWGSVLLFALPLLTGGKATIEDEINRLEQSNSKLLQYPTQFTQGIVPKSIHSHNDYWREVPLLTALSYGVASVEADVWLVNGTLYVGHELAALTPYRTLDSLYVDPLLKILDAQNPKNQFTVNITRPNGVFDTSSGTSLQLFVDIKTNGVETLPYILKAFEPLRKAGYLTTYANGQLIKSAVTIVGTGNSPLDAVKALSPRDYFFDAPLAQLANDTTWDATLSPVASTDYEATVGWSGLGEISEAQLSSLKTLVTNAHERGIAARFWDTPGWPVFARNNIWKILIENGVDWLNADDLKAASQF